MMTKTGAFVLRSVKYGDTTLIVDMLTREYGRLSFAVRMSKSPRSKVRRQLFQPATQMEVEFDFRPTAAVQRMKGAAVSSPYSTISTDPYKLAMVMFLSEFLCHATRSEQQNAPLYDYVCAGLDWLDGCGEAFSNFHIVFMMRLSRLLGFYPNMETQDDGRFFDLRSGCFTPLRPDHPDFLEPADAARIALLMRMDYPTMHLFAMSHADRNRCVDAILHFYRLHIPDFPELKSLDVVRELFR